MQVKNVTDDWKELFENSIDEPTFYASKATILISITASDYYVKIEIFNNDDEPVITIFTNHFSADIMEPEFDEMQRWTEQNFEGLTKPIVFDEPGMSVHLNNNGTEDWYEFLLDPEDNGDKIASISVRSFEIALM